MNADNWFDDDDRLAEELAVALRADRPAPSATADIGAETGGDAEAGITAMLMAGYDIVMADTVEAALVHDSSTDELAAVRSGDAGARMLTYAVYDRDLEIEFELVDGRVVGHVDPPEGGRINLEQPANADRMVETIEPDELGSFEFLLRSPATFRLRYVDAAGRSVATTWLDGPHPTAD